MRKLLLIIVCLLMSISGWSQDTIQYVKIGTQYDEVGIKIRQFSDSSFIVLANSGNDETQVNSNIQLITINSSGEVLNSISLGTSKSEKATNFSISQESAIVSGMSNGYSELYEGVIYFIGLNGILHKEYHESINGVWSTYSAQLIKEDTLIAVLEAFESEDLEPRIQRFTIDGEFIDEKVLNNSKGYHFNQILVTDKGYLGVGTILSDSSDAFLIKLNASFGLEWLSIMTTPGKEAFTGVTELSDSTIAVVGNSTGFFLSDQDIVVMKYDKNGQATDTLIQGYDPGANNKDDFVYSLFSKNDTLYSTGVTKTYGFGGDEAFITRLDKNINPIFGSGTFGTSNDEQSFDIIPYKSGVVGIGFSENNTKGLRDILFWKRERFTVNPTDIVISESTYSVSNFILEIDEVKSENYADVKISQSENNFLIQAPPSELIDIELVDMRGVSFLIFNRVHSRSFSIPKPGVYIIRIRLKNELIVKKVLVL